MNAILGFLRVAVVTFGLATNAYPATVVDQSSNWGSYLNAEVWVSPPFIPNTNVLYGVAEQTFTVGISGIFDTLSIQAKTFQGGLSGVGVFTVELWKQGTLVGKASNGYENLGYAYWSPITAQFADQAIAVNQGDQLTFKAYDANWHILVGAAYYSDYTQGQAKTVGMFANGGAPFNDYAFLTTVATVPEPEYYALLLAGLGVMGLIMLRHRNA